MAQFQAYILGFPHPVAFEARQMPDYADTGDWVDIGEYRVRQRAIIAIQDLSGWHEGDDGEDSSFQFGRRRRGL